MLSRPYALYALYLPTCPEYRPHMDNDKKDERVSTIFCMPGPKMLPYLSLRNKYSEYVADFQGIGANIQDKKRIETQVNEG